VASSCLDHPTRSKNDSCNETGDRSDYSTGTSNYRLASYLKMISLELALFFFYYGNCCKVHAYMKVRRAGGDHGDASTSFGGASGQRRNCGPLEYKGIVWFGVCPSFYLALPISVVALIFIFIYNLCHGSGSKDEPHTVIALCTSTVCGA